MPKATASIARTAFRVGCVRAYLRQRNALGWGQRREHGKSRLVVLNLDGDQPACRRVTGKAGSDAEESQPVRKTDRVRVLSDHGHSSRLPYGVSSAPGR